MDSQDREKEYQDFIKATRKHQAERERIKKLESKRNPPTEEYYIDISQVNTLVLDNLVRPPGEQPSIVATLDKKRQDIYGDESSKLKSMEQHIDDHFKSKCRELKPHFWPVIPIDPKPYLDPVRR